jgi:hypothetical protein
VAKQVEEDKDLIKEHTLAFNKNVKLYDSVRRGRASSSTSGDRKRAFFCIKSLILALSFLFSGFISLSFNHSPTTQS